ncbi:MAG: alpha/beta hydrolase [Deltaproteobacteria bacterium]|nr:alpha/beta hydrolase [Deltaproteobacteria bacterium]
MSEVEKEAVLFIHSTGTLPMMWSGVPESAIGGRLAIAPANLGYPPHPPVARGERVTTDAEVEHVLRAVPGEVRRLHVVAHSYGATIALTAVPRIADRLASLFLFEPVLFGALRHDPNVDPQIRSEAQVFASGPLMDEGLGGTEAWLEAFIDYWNRPGSWARLPPPMREHAIAMGWKMYQEVRACFESKLTFDEYFSDTPTTLARGERTTSHARAMIDQLGRGRPNVRTVELEKAGHMAPLTHPALVADEIAKHFAWLASM